MTDGIYVAIGYDLANTILIQTEEGHVVVDVAMNPMIAREMRADLEAVAGKAPIHSIIYTHSHVVRRSRRQRPCVHALLVGWVGDGLLSVVRWGQDHVGGADAWAENSTAIWGTDALTPHFFKQYGSFRKVRLQSEQQQGGVVVPGPTSTSCCCVQAESLRGGRQFGQDVLISELPCSGLGGKPDVRTTILTSAFLVPTHTFTGKTSFKVGRS